LTESDGPTFYVELINHTLQKSLQTTSASICNLKIVFWADFVSYIYNLKTVFWATCGSLPSLLFDFHWVSVACQFLGNSVW